MFLVCFESSNSPLKRAAAKISQFFDKKDDKINSVKISSAYFLGII